MGNNKYFYRGNVLYAYCRKYALDYDVVCHKISSLLRKNRKMSMDEAVKRTVESIDGHPFGMKTCLYNGVQVESYCKEHGLDYKSIRLTYMQDYIHKLEITRDKAFETIISQIEARISSVNRRKDLEDSIKNIRGFCMKRGFDYNNFRMKFIRDRKNNPEKDEIDVFESVVAFFEKKEDRADDRYKRHVYKGMPLYNYCVENGYNYDRVEYRFRKEYSKRSDLTYEEALDEIFKFFDSEKEFEKLNIRIDGMTLEEYCKKHQYSYFYVLKEFLEKYKDRYDISIKDAIKEIIESYKKVNPKNCRFTYNGLPLREHCIKSGISYQSVLAKYHREYGKNDDDIDEEGIRKCVEYFELKPAKAPDLVYKGKPLIEHCKELGVSYNSVKNRYFKLYYSREDISMDDAIDEIIRNLSNKPGRAPRYFLDGKPLIDLCKENGVNYGSLINRLVTRYKDRDDLTEEQKLIECYDYLAEKKKAKEEKLLAKGAIVVKKEAPKKEEKTNTSTKKETLSEIIEEIKERGLEKRKYASKVVYSIEGVPLIDICEYLDIDYYAVIHRYKNHHDDYKNFTLEEALKIIINDNLNHSNKKEEVKPVKIDDRGSLEKLCDEKNYSYYAIIRLIEKTKRENPTLSEEEIIENAIKKYRINKSRRYVNALFRDLKNDKIKDLSVFDSICGRLQVNFECFLDLVQLRFTWNQAIKTIWYCADDKQDNKLWLTGKKRNMVLGIRDYIKKTEDRSSVSLSNLLVIYKCDLLDTKEDILLKEKEYIESVVKRICKKYSVHLYGNKKDYFISIAKEIYTRDLDRCSIRSTKTFIDYVHSNLEKKFEIFIQWMLENEKKEKESVQTEFKPVQTEEKTILAKNEDILSELSIADIEMYKLIILNNYSFSDVAKIYYQEEDTIRQRFEYIEKRLKGTGESKTLLYVSKDN